MSLAAAFLTIDIDPLIGRLGPLSFGWYGLIMAAATLVGAAIFAHQAERRGIPREHAYGIMVLAIPAGILGARLVHVLDELGYYLDHPAEILGAQLIGLAIYGVLAGGLVGLTLYCRWKHLPLLAALDATALAFPVAQIIGRCANIINGDTWGSVTELAWGFAYVNPQAFLPDALLGVATHPTPLYEQLWLAVMLIVLLIVVPRLSTPGMAFLTYLALYSAGRLVISQFRENLIIALGLREAQLIAVAVLAATIPAALWLRRRAARMSEESLGGGPALPAERRPSPVVSPPPD